jgi:hypothetical protein
LVVKEADGLTHGEGAGGRLDGEGPGGDGEVDGTEVTPEPPGGGEEEGAQEDGGHEADPLTLVGLVEAK